MKYVTLIIIALTLSVFAEKFRIDKDGNIGVNNSTPEEKLDVEGNLKANKVRLRNSNSGDDPVAGDIIFDGSDFLGYNGTEWLSLTATGTTAQGDAGADGATWHTGSGAPDSSTGVSGDLYLDTTSYEIYEKGSSWASIGNIKGADAEQESNIWLTGNVNPSSSDGSDGDVYFNNDSFEIFENMGGAWTSLGNLDISTGTTAVSGSIDESDSSNLSSPKK